MGPKQRILQRPLRICTVRQTLRKPSRDLRQLARLAGLRVTLIALQSTIEMGFSFCKSFSTSFLEAAGIRVGRTVHRLNRVQF